MTPQTAEPTFLPDLYLCTKVNNHCHESGADSLESCLNPSHYLAYPHKVEYHYNSRGFRDSEWPDNLSDVIWCVGDSFTVGIGSPLEHTWPYLLQQRTGQRVINVSMDGASNDWISRMAQSIRREFPNAIIVAHWSFLHRRELSIEAVLEKRFPDFYKSVADTGWPICNSLDDFKKMPAFIQQEITQLHNWPEPVTDEHRRVYYTHTTIQDDIVNARTCMQQLTGAVVHTAIPNWAPATAQPGFDNVILTTQLDYARDALHYDVLTSAWLVDQIIPALAHCARR